MNTPEQKLEVADLIERLTIEADKVSPPHLRDLLTEAAEALEAFSEAVDAMSELIERKAPPSRENSHE